MLSEHFGNKMSCVMSRQYQLPVTAHILPSLPFRIYSLCWDSHSAYNQNLGITVCGLTWPHCHGKQSPLGCFGTSAGVCKGIRNKNLKYRIPQLYSRIHTYSGSARYIIKRVQVLSLIELSPLPSRLPQFSFRGVTQRM